MKLMKPICQKCKSMVKDMFGDKKQMPRWKTKVKGMQWECRNCGFVKDIHQTAFLEKKEGSFTQQMNHKVDFSHMQNVG